MKTKIHPQWNAEAVVTCNCGQSFTVGSTKDKINVEICARCHPFFTGEQRFADTRGKVKIFEDKLKMAKEKAPELAKRKAKKANLPQGDNSPKSLKEMLMGIK